MEQEHRNKEISVIELSALVPMRCCPYHQNVWENAFRVLQSWWQHQAFLFGDITLDTALTGEYNNIAETLFVAFFQIAGIETDAQIAHMVHRVAELTGSQTQIITSTPVVKSNYDN